MLSLEELSLHHVNDTSRCTNNNVYSLRKGLLIGLDVSSSGTAVNLGTDEFAEADHHALDLMGQLTGRSKDQCLDVVVADINTVQYGN